MQLDQPELGLAREFLAAGPLDPVVMGYKDFMIQVFLLIGVDPDTAVSSAQNIVEFEMKLANITMPRWSVMQSWSQGYSKHFEIVTYID